MIYKYLHRIVEVEHGTFTQLIFTCIIVECELVALLEDDTGMELLVNNKIISLDLPVDQVYRKIWCGGKGDNKEPMKIVYRMRGLLGDATEDMIESLDSEKGRNNLFKVISSAVKYPNIL